MGWGLGGRNLVKKRLLTAAQIAITLAILYFVFRDPAKRAEMAEALRRADLIWLLAGFLAYGVIEVLATIRWQWLLRVQGIDLAWTRVFALTFIGVFFNFCIPGGTGGDVVKIFYLLKETPGKRAQALLSVFVDRIIGVVTLALLAGVFVLTNWSWLTSVPGTLRYVWLTVIILASSLGGLHMSYLITKHGWLHRLPARMPGRDKLAELALAYNLYGKAWRPTLGAALLSFGTHFGYFATFYFAGRAYHDAGTRVPTFTEITAIMPIINTLAAMPISLGGLGVREGLFQIFFGQLCGVSEAVAVITSTTGYLLTLAWGLIGGVVYILYRRSEHARLREMRESVAKFEHKVAEDEIAHEVETEKGKR
jgi:glycosyltransferase 2 family protein